ncbi:SAM-dependent methyltransferase [Actinokineospora soli]|uniref:SAM-dependent methyltransferase n=1 Tax=Actinokineospora soli TaxID=1048753 RepID=A0ABW2TLN6_9PSEU
MTSPDIGRHYDERSPIEDEIRDGQIHMWYWYDRDDDAPLSEALHRITRKVTDTLGLRAGERVLDAGCGTGETAAYLARTHGVSVTGVTISAFEAGKAAERAAAAGVAERTAFDLGDFHALPYADGSFDAVLALESLQNANDLPQVLGEFFRVLRPGGRLTFSDLCLGAPGDPARLAKFVEALKLPALPPLSGWLDLVRGAGFAVEEYTECGPRVFGMKAKFLAAAMARRDEVAAKVGEAALSEFSRKNMGFFAPRKDQVGYAIVSARKPH